VDLIVAGYLEPDSLTETQLSIHFSLGTTMDCPMPQPTMAESRPIPPFHRFIDAYMRLGTASSVLGLAIRWCDLKG